MAIFVDENHQGRLPGPHRQPGPVPRPAQQGVRHPGRGGHQPEEGRHRRRGRSDLRQRRRGARSNGRDRVVHLHSRTGREGRRDRGGRSRHRIHRRHHRGSARARRGVLLQRPQAALLEHTAARAQLSGHHFAGQVQHRHHAGRDRVAGRARRHRLAFGHAHLPSAARDVATRHRPDHVRRHRR